MIKLMIGLLAVLSILVAADFFIPKEHVAFPWESIPGFYAVFGLLAAIVLLIVSKILGRFFIQKKENYYDD